MYTTLFIFATAITSVLASPQSTTSTGTPLGAQCNPYGANTCAGGASCYATNAGLTPLCGNFQAQCVTDSQCAFNTCNAGFCNGLKTSSTTPSTPSTTPSNPTPTGTNLPLGAPCNPALWNVCAGGASCYAVNSMLIPSCGNFQAVCTSDAQCAFNTCVNGFCSGLKPSSTTPATPSTTPSAPKPTGTNLPLGASCNPSLTNACANGVSCYATNSMLMPICGNFQASCTSNSQCAFNTCNSGLCNGVLPSASPTITTYTILPTGGTRPSGNATRSGSPTTSPTYVLSNGADGLATPGGVVGSLVLIAVSLFML